MNTIGISLLSLALVVPGTLLAKGSHYKSGIYAGAQVGFGHLWGTQKGEYSFSNGVADRQSNGSYNQGDRSFSGDLYGGGRYVASNGLTFGGEILGSYGKHTIQSTYVDGQTFTGAGNSRVLMTLHNSWTVAPLVVVGYHFNSPVHLYGKLGPVISKFETKSSQAFERSRSTTKTGIAAALGVEYAFTSKLSANLSLNYERYPDVVSTVSNITATSVTPGVTETFINTSNGLQQFTPKIGLTYSF